MKFSVQVDGLDELDKQLGKLDNATSGKLLYAGLNYASGAMFKDIKDRAPRSAAPYRRYMSGGQGKTTWVQTKTGKWRAGKSLRAKRGEGEFVIQQSGLLKKGIRRKRLTKGNRDPHRAAVGIFVGVGSGKTFGTPYYWYFIEHGTRYRPATPFVRPAYQQGEHLVVERFKQNLAKGIKKYNK